MMLLYSPLFVLVLLIQQAVCSHKYMDIFNQKNYTDDIEEPSDRLVSYLGMTYDIIKGNPNGDPRFMIDLGFKRYILNGNLELNNNLIKTKIKQQHTNGNESTNENAHESKNQSKNNKIYYTATEIKHIKCSDHHKQTIINELSDIDDEYKSYKISTQYNIHPFNGSNYYKLLTHKINIGDSIIIKKYICSKYFLSLHNVNADKLNRFFISTLNELGNKYQDIKGDKYKCNLKSYKHDKYNKNCLKSVTPWINFFNLYGTHLVSGAYFGGGIINNLFVENESLNSSSYKIKLNSRELNPFYNKKFIVNFGSILSNKKVIYIKERALILNGGEHVEIENAITKNSYDKWKDSIKGNLAKPIKLIFISFADFITSEEGKVAYYEALELYSDLSYSNYNPYTFRLHTNEGNLYKMYIKKFNQYIEKSVNVNISPKCVEGERIISGFIITNKKKPYGDSNMLHVCPYSDSCYSGIRIESDKSFEFSWILCNDENFNEVKQVKNVSQGNGKITCPSNMKIGFGFSFTTHKSLNTNISLKACDSNKKSCKTKDLDENSETILWINCFPDNKTKLLNSLESKTYTKKIFLNDKTVVSLKCSNGKYIIAGFAVDYVSSNINNYFICSIGSSTCDFKINVEETNKNEMHIPIIYIICSSI